MNLVETSDFIQKLWQILHQPQFLQIIKWNQEGTAFLIQNINQFSKQILPKYFKHSNYHSFVKQLSIYGFSKNQDQFEPNQFSHKFFKKNNKQLIGQIKKKGFQESFQNSKNKKNTSSQKVIKQQNDKSVKAASIQQKSIPQQLIIPQNPLLFNPPILQYKCNSCNYTESIMLQIYKQNQQLKLQYKLEQTEKNNTIQKFNIFLNYLNNQMNQKSIYQRDQSLSTDMVKQIIKHIKNECEPYTFNFYQKISRNILQFPNNSQQKVQETIINNIILKRPLQNEIKHE